MTWNKFPDVMPPIKKQILIYINDGDYKYYELAWLADNKTWERCSTSDDSAFESILIKDWSVTHWCELQAPGKKEEE